MREFNFDGIVGPTHNYGGLAAGNVASISHGGRVSNPRSAALQGLRKMQFVRSLGVGQAVLPPQPRPAISVLRSLGFHGSDSEVLASAAAKDNRLLRLCSSAASMWTANAATVAPSCDTADQRVHFTPANLHTMFHRSIEAQTTTRVLRAIFADEKRFAVHDPLPGGGQFSDEGAANHIRLSTSAGKAHLFAWGKSAFDKTPVPMKHPARQTLESFQAVARLHRLAPESVHFPQQHPDGIDAGAFHTDVLAVGSGSFLMMHELAFVNGQRLAEELRVRLGDELSVEWASNSELPAADAVGSYPFNSQVLSLPDGTMAIIAPADAYENPRARAFLDRVVAGKNPVQAVHYLDVRESMDNGGGPACLRLRVPLTPEEESAITARVFVDESLLNELDGWIRRHYRDRLVPDDLGDTLLWIEGMTALDELTRLLKLGSVFEFQR